MPDLSPEHQRLIETVREMLPEVQYVDNIVKARLGGHSATRALDVLALKLARLEKLEDDVEAAREALRYARDAIASPDIAYAPGKDIYDTHMMMGALRRADAALALLAAREEEAT